MTHRWMSDWGGFHVENEIGFDGRFDDIRNIGLYHTEARERLSTTRQDRVQEGSAAVYLQNETEWSPKFRTILGLRGDLYHFDVVGESDPENGGRVTQGIFSPKLSMVFGPFDQTEFYLNGGSGFHSNDARGTTITEDPATGEPVGRVTPLARATAVEIGVRSLPIPKWQTTVAFWGLDLASELVFVGDAGTTEPSRPSRRYGVEWSNFYRVVPWADDRPRPLRLPGPLPGLGSRGQLHPRLGRERRRRPASLWIGWETSSEASGSATSDRGLSSKTTASARSPPRR